MDIFVLLGSFTVVCLLGMPVAYALGLASILAALYIGLPLEAIMLKVAGGMSGFSLLAIPFFVLAGAIMAIGGMAERLVNLAKVFVGAIRGGMALVNILASTMFGCISGSSVADTAAVSATEEPEMHPNMVEAIMLTIAMPPRMKPTKTLARLTSRSAMPPTAMIAPASMKNGIANSEKPLMPPETFSMTASSGMPTHRAVMMEASPRA